MDLIITSGAQNPAEFIANFPQSITLNEDYEMAVKSIFTAPYFNFTEENNRFTIVVLSETTDIDPILPSLGGDEIFREKRVVKDWELVDFKLPFEIPPGHYSTTCEVMSAMEKVLCDAADDPNSPLEEKPKFAIKNGRVNLHFYKKTANSRKKKPGEIFFIVEANPQQASVLNYLGYCSSQEDEYEEELDVEVYAFTNAKKEAFLYSSVVTNSMIDQQASRILCIFPVGGKTGYNYHEFMNPI